MQVMVIYSGACDPLGNCATLAPMNDAFVGGVAKVKQEVNYKFILPQEEYLVDKYQESATDASC